MRFSLAALALALATPVHAQPLPDTIRSAGLTEAQADELNRRLGALQGRFSVLAGETQLREAAVRNIAVEIFGAQPDLNFEAYASLIDIGARELRTLLTQARGRAESDPAAAALRAQAIAAAEEGRLSDARAHYDQLIARTTETLEARWAREDRERDTQRRAQTLAVATDMAEAAQLAFAAADDVDAARRYGEAAERAPEGARERWLYRIRQSEALTRRGARFGERDTLLEAVRILRDIALPLVPRETAPSDWAQTQDAIGRPLRILGERDAQAAREAVTAYRDALQERTRQRDPIAWAESQNSLGIALRISSRRDGSWLDTDEAIAAHEAALEVFTRDAHPLRWAEVQMEIANTLIDNHRSILGDNSDRHKALYAAALEVLTRENASFLWAQAENGYANALVGPGSREDNERAAQGYRAALEIFPRSVTPRDWATLKYNLGTALYYAGFYDSDGALLENAIVEFNFALEVHTRDGSPGLWVEIEKQLGDTYYRLAWLRSDTALLDRALEPYSAALSYYEAIDNDWGMSTVRTSISWVEAHRERLNASNHQGGP